MTGFSLAQAADANGEARSLALACARDLQNAGDHTLGFVYATSQLAQDFESIIETLKSETGVETWVGTVGHGICATGAEYFGIPAIVAMTGTFTHDEFQLISTQLKPDEITAPSPAPNGLPFAAALGVVHADPRNDDISEIVSAYAETSGAYLVGGLTSADDAFVQTAGTGGVEDGGLSGVLIGGRRQVGIGLTQGCSPIGPVHRVTGAQDNVIITLDDKPAFEVLTREAKVDGAGDPSRTLANVQVALMVGRPESGDYVVRHLVGVDAARGLVAITDEVDETTRVMFVRRDAENAAADLERMLDDIAGRLSGPPVAGLYFSCLARGPQLFADSAYEPHAIAKRFGDIPIVGFFGNGEISSDRIYAYTGVLVLFE